jgi:hypothetical protein
VCYLYLVAQFWILWDTGVRYCEIFYNILAGGC